MCLMNGANPAWVARQMGHKSLKMFFEVYARWIDRADKGLEKARMDAATARKTSSKTASSISLTGRRSPK
jgi:integrase